MLYRNLNYYLIFIILIQLFNIMVYAQKYIPGPRLGHAAVYIEPELKIYYIGGENPYKLPSELDPESDFFYLDFNEQISEICIDLKSQGVKLPHTFGHTANIGGVNQDSIFIIGGAHLDEKNTNYLYRFDTKTYELSEPVIQGIAPQTRIRLDSVSYGGKIYLFGGRTFNYNMLDNESEAVYVSSFDILDTINLNWQVGSLINSPVTLTGYTATLVNGIIYYIGGRSQRYVFLPMTDIYQYNTFADEWSLKKATFADIKAKPGARIGHSAVLYDGKIFVYGGIYFTSETYDMPAKETFIMLDTVTLVWSIPPLNDTNVPKLTSHTATLIKGSLMIVNFGILMDLPITDNKLIYLFHLENPNFKWSKYNISGKIATPSSSSPLSTIPVQTRPPDTSYTKSSDTSSSTKMSKMVIVGVSVGSVIIVLTIILVCSLAYKRIKRNQMRTKRESSQLDGQSAFNGVGIQVPPDNDKYSMYLQYSPVHQQFSSQQQYSVATSPPIQLHQEHSDLSISPSPQKRFSN